MFSYHSRNFMQQEDAPHFIKPINQGFILSSNVGKDAPHKEGYFAIFADAPNTVVDHCWFRGGWFDPLSMVWNTVTAGETKQNNPVEGEAPGASLYVPVSLKPGEKRKLRLMMAWYVPNSNLRIGEFEEQDEKDQSETRFYRPWYSSRFKNIEELADFWKTNYDQLQQKSRLFSKAFYNSTLPPEVVEAVALTSPF